MSVEFLYSYTGGGKSFAAMVKVREHLFQGGVVGLNFRLTEDWAYIMAMEHPHVKRGKMDYEECVQSLYDRCFFIGQVHTVEELVEHYKKRCIGPAARRYERQVLVVIDEAGLYLNTRDYRKNLPWVELFTQHRKMGLDLILIAHHINYIDNQARHLISFVTRVVNFHEEVRIPGTNVRWPWVFFMYLTRPRLGGRPHLAFARFTWAIAELYDTFEVFGFDKLSGVIERQGVFNSVCSSFGKPAKKRKAFPKLTPGRYWINFLTEDESSLADATPSAC